MVLFTKKHFVDSKRIYEGGIINLRVDTLNHPDGKVVEREVVEHNGGVVIACRPKPNQIILIRQYRYALDEELLELPAGRIEKNEDPLPAAQRELTEETGFFAKTWKEIARMYSAPGFCNELLYVYEASDVEFVGTKLDDDEEIDVMELELKDAWELVSTGKIRDAKTIAGLGLLMASQYS